MNTVEIKQAQQNNTNKQNQNFRNHVSDLSKYN